MRSVKEGQYPMPGVLESVETKEGLIADCVIKEDAGIFTMADNLIGTTNGSMFFAKRQSHLGLDTKTAGVFQSVGTNAVLDENGKRVLIEEGRYFRVLKKNTISLDKRKN